jgi:hypothetical protein
MKRNQTNDPVNLRSKDMPLPMLVYPFPIIVRDVVLVAFDSAGLKALWDIDNISMIVLAVPAVPTLAVNRDLGTIASTRCRRLLRNGRPKESDLMIPCCGSA